MYPTCATYHPMLCRILLYGAQMLARILLYLAGVLPCIRLPHHPAATGPVGL